METFFGHYGNPFEMYSLQHGVALLFIILVLGTVIWFRAHLRKPGWNRKFRYGLALLMLLLHVGLHLWYLTTGNWTAEQSLPFHLCTLTLFLSILLLFFRNFYLYEFVFFAGTLGAIQALLTPVLDVAFPHFWYFYFFIGHGGILLTALFMTAVEGFRPTWISVARTMLWLNVLMVFVIPVNALTGANYMFLARKPDTVSLLDFLGPWPWYIISLEIVALVLCILLYLPFILFERWKLSGKSNNTRRVRI
ncbi:YwaF family protein [Robertmurraya sp. GLU-23]